MAPEASSITNGDADSFVDTVDSLRLERSDLRRQIEDLQLEMERSGAESKSLAFHASYLEGELLIAQENLTAASVAAEDAASEISRLKNSVKSLEESGIEKDKKIAELEDEVKIRVSKEEGLEKTMKEMEKRISEFEKIEAELKTKVTSVDVLENTVKELMEKVTAGEVTERALKERNSELEKKLTEKLAELAERKIREVQRKSDVIDTGVSWVTTAGAAACTGAVAVAVTALYLRKQN